jgi:hypothetical protein
MRATLSFLFLMVACGGRVSDPDAGPQGSQSGSGTPPDGEGGSGSGGGTPTTGLPCPILPPAIGDACYVPAETVCAYLVNNLPCQATLCDDTGHWQSTRIGC